MKNSEKYKTVKERTEAFKEWCEHHFVTGCKTVCETCTECQFAWLEQETEEEKILPCPFCCESTEVHAFLNCEKEVRIQCSCGYRGAWYDDIETAVAEHNRVARAVMEKKGVAE